MHGTQILPRCSWAWPLFPFWADWIRDNRPIDRIPWPWRRGEQYDLPGEDWDRGQVTYYRPRPVEYTLAESLYPGQGHAPPWNAVAQELQQAMHPEWARLQCCAALEEVAMHRLRQAQAPVPIYTPVTAHVNYCPVTVLQEAPESERQIRLLAKAVRLLAERIMPSHPGPPVSALEAPRPKAEISMPSGAGTAIDAPTRPKIAQAEADAAARRLAKKNPGFVLGTAEEWAAAIERATSKTCSATMVKGLPFWTEEMERQGRARSRARGKGRPGARSPRKPMHLSAPIEQSQPDRTANNPLEILVADEQFHLVEQAEHAIQQSGMRKDAKGELLKQLHDGKKTPKEAMQIVELLASPV